MSRYNQVEIRIAQVINNVAIISLLVVSVYLSVKAFGYYSQFPLPIIGVIGSINIILVAYATFGPLIWLHKRFRGSRIEFLNLLAYAHMSSEERLEYEDELDHR